MDSNGETDIQEDGGDDLLANVMPGGVASRERKYISRLPELTDEE